MLCKSKIMPFIISFILILGICFCSVAIFNNNTVNATNYSSSSSSSYSSSKSTSSSYSTSSSKGSSSNSSKSTLLPSTGEEIDAAQSQDWDTLMSQIENDTDSNEFTFDDSSTQSSAYATKLFWLGVLMISISVLGIWFLIYSNFFSKKCARNKNKLANVALSNKRNSTNNKMSDNKPVSTNKGQTKRVAPKYGDGYGYSKAKHTTTSKKNKNIDDYVINISSDSSNDSKYKHDADGMKSRVKTNEIYSDSSFSTRELQKDVFWNEFFRKQ